MQARTLFIGVVCLMILVAVAGCESCASRVNNTVTIEMRQNQRARHVVCHEHGGSTTGVVEIDVFRSGHSVWVSARPLAGHELQCASVCVGTLSADPARCENWVRATRRSDGSLQVTIQEDDFSPGLCTLESHVHVRMRVTHCGSCDT